MVIDTGFNSYNTEVCDWDGGDCCENTCSSTTWDCGSTNFDCLDPDPSNTESCSVSQASYLGDGYCDAIWSGEGYNTLGCDWDGGDCCRSSCFESAHECGLNGACID